MEKQNNSAGKALTCTNINKAVSAGMSLQGQEKERTSCAQGGFVHRNPTVFMHSEIHRGENSERKCDTSFSFVIETWLQLEFS